MIIFLIAIFLISPNAHSDSLQFSRENDKIIVRGLTCGEIEKELPNFRLWVEKIKHPPTCEYKKIPGNKCGYDITECVPDHVRQYEGKSGKIEGPNCTNLALVMGQLIPHLRYASGDEFAFFLRPPLCEEIDPAAPKKAGDIGALVVKSDVEPMVLHGFIYVSENVSVFQKWSGCHRALSS